MHHSNVLTNLINNNRSLNLSDLLNRSNNHNHKVWHNIHNQNITCNLLHNIHIFKYGGTQSVVNVNLPRTNNQYGTTPQQTYGYNTQSSQRAPSYGASGYSGPPNDNRSQQNPYKGNNDDNIRYDGFY